MVCREKCLTHRVYWQWTGTPTSASIKVCGRPIDGTFENQDVVTRLVNAQLLEQTDEWTVQRRRFMALEQLPICAMIPSSGCLSSQPQLSA
jgi:hypothetical protein